MSAPARPPKGGASQAPERAQPANRHHPLIREGGRGEGWSEPARPQPANHGLPGQNRSYKECIAASAAVLFRGIARGLILAWLGSASAGALANEDGLLEKIAAALEPAPVIVTEFTQTRRIAGLKQPVVSNGRVVFARGKGLVWQIERPYRYAYVFGANARVEIDAKGERRQRQSGETGGASQGAQVFDALLRGDLAALRGFFDVQVQGSPEAWTAQLRPRRGEVAGVLRQLSLKGGREVKEIALAETSGDFTLITLRLASRGDALSPADAQLFAQ